MLIEFLHQIRAHYKNKKIVLIMDNASYHRCKRVRKWCLKYPEIFIGYLPPYAPEYNPTEQIWKWLKTNISRVNVDYKDLAERTQALRKICWAWSENRLIDPINVGIGLWSLLL